MLFQLGGKICARKRWRLFETTETTTTTQSGIHHFKMKPILHLTIVGAKNLCSKALKKSLVTLFPPSAGQVDPGKDPRADAEGDHPGARGRVPAQDGRLAHRGDRAAVLVRQRHRCAILMLCFPCKTRSFACALCFPCCYYCTP